MLKKYMNNSNENHYIRLFSGRGPIITKLHIRRKHTGIVGLIFEDYNCDKFRAREQLKIINNLTHVF